jgi:hypothetical protein
LRGGFLTRIPTRKHQSIASDLVLFQVREHLRPRRRVPFSIFFFFFFFFFFGPQKIAKKKKKKKKGMTEAGVRAVSGFLVIVSIPFSFLLSFFMGANDVKKKKNFFLIFKIKSEIKKKKKKKRLATALGQVLAPRP